jgi:hypothetical protein
MTSTRVKTVCQTTRTAVLRLAFPLVAWKSSSTKSGHKTYYPKYFHRFSPYLQAILCYTVQYRRPQGMTADIPVKPMSVLLIPRRLERTLRCLVSSCYTRTSDGLIALVKCIQLNKEDLPQSFCKACVIKKKLRRKVFTKNPTSTLPCKRAHTVVGKFQMNRSVLD